MFEGLPFRPTKRSERKLWRSIAKHAACEECRQTPAQLTEGSLLGWAIWFTPGPDSTVVHVLCPHHSQIITRSQDGGRA
jgi:hypothetical protein